MGSRGMPRRYATYVPEYAPFHQASTIGAIILGSGIALMVFYLLASLFQGKKAMQNQWGGVTLDWLAPTPPPLENFVTPPKVVHEVYDYSTLDLETMRTPVS
jgi:cytochrome c oxidase subunit 1